MDKNQEILIITGGTLDQKWAKEWIRKNQFDYVIAADSGLNYADILEIPVNYILGDYDSVNENVISKYREKNIELIEYPTEKDYTDTHLAISAAIERGAENITIIGATGSRMDHTLANIQNMLLALEAKVDCCIMDANNKIYLTDKRIDIYREKQYGDFISLIALTPSVIGLTLRGFYYPLNEYHLKQGLSIGISNKIVEEKATIEFQKGVLVVFESKDN